MHLKQAGLVLEFQGSIHQLCGLGFDMSPAGPQETHWEMDPKQFPSRAETWCEAGVGEVKLAALRLETCKLRDSCHSAGRAVRRDDRKKGKGV